MMVMVSNQTNVKFMILAGRYPGTIGHLYTPGGARTPISVGPVTVQYGLDNGVYAAWEKNIDFDDAAFEQHLEWAAKQEISPLWAVARDVVADCVRTRELYPRYAAMIRDKGIRPAFAVQNGAQFYDVPDGDCMLFIGGTVDWKMQAVGPWCRQFPGRIHVGKVNDGQRLMKCYEAGATSVDGTGWWHEKSTRRRPGSQFQDLVDFCAFQEHDQQRRRAA